jgi:hypothetical protein
MLYQTFAYFAIGKVGLRIRRLTNLTFWMAVEAGRMRRFLAS